MATKKKSFTALALLEGCPRVRGWLDDATYMGCCVVQSPGAWCRIGPTWRLKRGDWLTIGPGIKEWGTTEGLAELSAAPTPKPEWHSTGIALSPAPNLVFAMVDAAIDHCGLRGLADEAESLLAEVES